MEAKREKLKCLQGKPVHVDLDIIPIGAYSKESLHKTAARIFKLEAISKAVSNFKGCTFVN